MNCPRVGIPIVPKCRLHCLSGSDSANVLLLWNYNNVCGKHEIKERYEPLIESLGECLNEESKADKKYKRKQKLKKCKKNFLKALRAGWNYFVLGVQEFANNYTMPYAAPFTVIAEMR
ncbi:required for drug-induced death protein 1-like isoform X2 [Heptranchias perlo]|uniref:required for drug-induced death protein 1-like isoform X2 n=1 Tax=Heptranchias perlo TaxID=212740 RepID=UPI0035597403